MIADRTAFPLPWKTVALTVIPGMLATIGLVKLDFSTQALAGMVLLLALVAAAWIHNNRQLPAWSLMALGFLTYTSLTLVFGVLGGLVSLATGAAADPTSSLVVQFALWAPIIALSIRFLRGQHVPLLIGLLASLIIVCNILIRLKYLVLIGVSWSVVWDMLGISLWAAGLLLLPVAIGLRLARKHGALAMLFVVGATFLWFQNTVDYDRKLSSYMDSSLYPAFMVILPLLFTLIAPLLFLRIESARGRIGGLLASVGLAVVTNLIITGLVRGDFTLIIWLGVIPYTISILLNLTMAYLLYQEMGNCKLAR